VEDVPTLVRHRHSMFEAMGYIDRAALDLMDANFSEWVREKLARDEYHGWFLTDAANSIIAGAGVWIYEWVPGPTDASTRRAVIYNVYTEPEYRRRGLARILMNKALKWCRTQGIRTVTLHASDKGRKLYELLGFEQTDEMRLEFS
jgi:GNAT superfamily N-acetyltransferase